MNIFPHERSMCARRSCRAAQARFWHPRQDHARVAATDEGRGHPARTRACKRQAPSNAVLSAFDQPGRGARGVLNRLCSVDAQQNILCSLFINIRYTNLVVERRDNTKHGRTMNAERRLLCQAANRLPGPQGVGQPCRNPSLAAMQSGRRAGGWCILPA